MNESIERILAWVQFRKTELSKMQNQNPFQIASERLFIDDVEKLARYASREGEMMKPIKE